jgi:integrase
MEKPVPFSEARVRAIKPPDADREYHKDSQFPGLQLCVTANGAKTYYFVKRISGRPTRVRLGTVEQLSVAAARKAAATVTGAVATGKNPQQDRRDKRQEPTLGDLFAHWMLHAKAHKKPKSYLEDERQYNASLKPWQHRRLSTIKKADVQALHANMGQENGIYAANRLLALLRAMFNKADDLGFRGDNPCHGIKLFREQSRDRFLQPDELSAFFTALATEPNVRDFYLALLLTGARRSNVQSMRWEDIELQAGFWRIPGEATKGGIPVIVPLVGPLLAILNERKANANGTPWVFPGRDGKAMANPKGAWKRILARSRLGDLHPHDLRRSLGSWMAGQNTSLTIIGRALGHRTPQATMVYARLAIDPVREAVDRAATAMLTIGGQTKMLTGEPVKQEANADGT